MAERINLLSNAAATGSATNIPVRGQYLIMATATFNGATIKLQMLSPDGTNYMDVSGASFTAAGHALVNLGAGQTVKAVVSGGPPSAAYVSLDLVVQ